MQIDVDPQEDQQNAPDINYVVENPTLVGVGGRGMAPLVQGHLLGSVFKGLFPRSLLVNLEAADRQRASCGRWWVGATSELAQSLFSCTSLGRGWAACCEHLLRWVSGPSDTQTWVFLGEGALS